ncbi:MAG: HAD-IC family P-type ATPase, partial [Clostridia bacterium]|nr:HAD-IC family P-type ATPase [Clostridia bacterium]
ENGKKAFDKLRKAGIKKLYVLSGDKKNKVDAVASTLYADGAYSQLLPGQKLDALEDIIESGQNVRIGYCGDGINDLPCISRADVGIAIGTVSTDAAVERSDLVIIDDDLEKIPRAIEISKNAKKRAIGNIIFAISTKVIIGALSIALPFFPMTLAVFADVGVMLITIINSLFAGRGRK